MNLTRCDKGHFYDADKHTICPYCDKTANVDKNNTFIDQFDTFTNYHNKIVIKRVWVNLSKWFVQTIFFSLIPLFFIMLTHWMFQLQEISLNKYICELCPFTLVISSSTALELAKEKYVNTNIKEVIFPAYLILLILFFMLYGATVISFELDIPLKSQVLNNIFFAVVLISIIHLIIGILLQVLGGLYDE